MNMKRTTLVMFTLLAITIAVSSAALAEEMSMGKAAGHTSSKFEGVKANTGTVTHTKVNGKNVLTLSDDFVPPETPDPHWQVVDSKGNVYLLDRLKAKGEMSDMGMQNGKYNKSITLPAYVKDVAKVQIWCAFAEVN